MPGQLVVLLEEALQARGWKEADLVRATGLKQSRINRLLTGVTKEPEPDLFHGVAEALELPVETLAAAHASDVKDRVLGALEVAPATPSFRRPRPDRPAPVAVRLYDLPGAAGGPGSGRLADPGPGAPASPGDGVTREEFDRLVAVLRAQGLLPDTRPWLHRVGGAGSKHVLHRAVSSIDPSRRARLAVMAGIGAAPIREAA